MTQSPQREYIVPPNNGSTTYWLSLHRRVDGAEYAVLAATTKGKEFVVGPVYDTVEEDGVHVVNSAPFTSDHPVFKAVMTCYLRRPSRLF